MLKYHSLFEVNGTSASKQSDIDKGFIQLWIDDTSYSEQQGLETHANKCLYNDPLKENQVSVDRNGTGFFSHKCS